MGLPMGGHVPRRCAGLMHTRASHRVRVRVAVVCPAISGDQEFRVAVHEAQLSRHTLWLSRWSWLDEIVLYGLNPM